MDTENPLLSRYKPLQELHDHAKTLKVIEYPYWKRTASYYPSGIREGGWTRSSKFVIVTNDICSVNDSFEDKELLVLDLDKLPQRHYAPPYLKIHLRSIKETVMLFGVTGGNGVTTSSQLWHLKVIYPWWPVGLIIIEPPYQFQYPRPRGVHGYPIFEFPEGWIRFGFSPNGKHFVIFTSEYVHIFTKQE